MKSLVRIAKALSDETRVRALFLLERGELCLCDIVATLGKANSTLSRHMSELVAAGFVTSRREGRWNHYRQVRRGAPPAVRDAMRWARRTLADDPVIARDARKVATVLSQKDQCGR